VFGQRITAKTPGEADVLRRLSKFRPSDKRALLRLLETTQGVEDIYNGVTIYVEVWDRAQWLEDYAVERIGRWVKREGPAELTDRFDRWARGKGKARVAFRNGLHGLRVAREPEALTPAD